MASERDPWKDLLTTSSSQNCLFFLNKVYHFCLGNVKSLKIWVLHYLQPRISSVPSRKETVKVTIIFLIRNGLISELFQLGDSYSQFCTRKISYLTEPSQGPWGSRVGTLVWTWISYELICYNTGKNTGISLGNPMENFTKQHRSLNVQMISRQVWSKPEKQFTTTYFGNKFHSTNGTFRSIIHCFQWKKIIPHVWLDTKHYPKELQLRKDEHK